MKELPTKEQILEKHSYISYPKGTGIIEAMEEYAALRAMPLVEGLDEAVRFINSIEDFTVLYPNIPYSPAFQAFHDMKERLQNILSSYTGGADTTDVELNCMVCGKTFYGPEPKMCCSGRKCGCMGFPDDPVVCSEECFNNLPFNRSQAGGVDTQVSDKNHLNEFKDLINNFCLVNLPLVFYRDEQGDLVHEEPLEGVCWIEGYGDFSMVVEALDLCKFEGIDKEGVWSVEVFLRRFSASDFEDKLEVASVKGGYMYSLEEHKAQAKTEGADTQPTQKSTERYPGEGENDLKDLIIHGIEEGAEDWRQRALDAEEQVIKIKKKIDDQKQIDELKALHYNCRDFLYNQDFRSLVLYLAPIIDKGEINELKTIQIVLSSFNNHPLLNSVLKTVNEKVDAFMNNWKAGGADKKEEANG